jgi:hypothetical protein
MFFVSVAIFIGRKHHMRTVLKYGRVKIDFNLRRNITVRPSRLVHEK